MGDAVLCEYFSRHRRVSVEQERQCQGMGDVEQDNLPKKILPTT